MKTLLGIMAGINLLIVVTSLLFVVDGFVKQDVPQIGYSLLPLIFYGLTLLSLILYWADDAEEYIKFLNLMGFFQIVSGIAGACMILGGFVGNDIHFLNWGFPLLFIGLLTGISMLSNKT